MSPVDQTLLQALTAGIQAEVASYVFYLKASKKSLADQIKSVLENLASEEKEHFFILERQYDSLVRSEKWNTTADVLRQGSLPEINEEMNETHRELIEEVSRTDSILAVLDIAYRLEVEAADMFGKAAATMTSDDGKRMFERLAKIEQGHQETISRMMQQFA